MIPIARPLIGEEEINVVTEGFEERNACKRKGS